MNRRQFLAATGITVGFALHSRIVGATSHAHHPSVNAPRLIPPPVPTRVARPFINQLRLPTAMGLCADVALREPLRLTAKSVRQQLFPGRSTDMLVYEADRHGEKVWNPILRVRQGSALDVTLRNELGEDTTIHWHGLHVDEKNDGGGMHPVHHFQQYVYRFPVNNRPGLYWYHPHPHDRTGTQVHQGLAGLLLVEGEEDDALRRSLGLIWGETELPLLIQDKQIDTLNKLKYSMGEDDWIGNRVMVNWTPEPCHDVATCLYRLRVLNGSNARVYRLAFLAGGKQLPFTLIGSDGGLLQHPQHVREAFLAPAQRLDILIDFEKVALGSAVTLTSLAYDPMENDGAPPVDPAIEHPGAALMGEALDIMQFNVKRAICATRILPNKLASPLKLPAAKNRIPRRFRVHMKGLTWLINGKNYHQSMHDIEFVVKGGDAEVWEIRNDIRSMPHPMHVHGFHFRVIERRGSPRQVGRQALNISGITPTDLGWMDTVLVWPGEVVKVLVDFSPALAGKNTYMFHCHNLEHEDQGLMLNFRVDA
jgi:blue copper oxidase